MKALLSEKMQRQPLVTIDGPGGVGKTTIGLMLAQRLGWSFLDSGLFYRLLAWQYLNKEEAASLSDVIALGMNIDLSGYPESIILNGQDVKTLLHNEACGQQASQLAGIEEVRAALLSRQRDCYDPEVGLVAIGRDMGSVVFKGTAGLKIYLDASLDERAKRRHDQLQAGDKHVKVETIYRDMELRDQRDQSRAIAPLKVDEDYLVVDSTDLSVDQVVQSIFELCCH